MRPRPDTARPLPVIIDTDVGDDIDDAFALTVALKDSRLEVLGVTTAWGDTRTPDVVGSSAARDPSAARDVVVAPGTGDRQRGAFTQSKWALGATDTSPAPDAIESSASRRASAPENHAPGAGAAQQHRSPAAA